MAQEQTGNQSNLDSADLIILNCENQKGEHIQKRVTTQERALRVIKVWRRLGYRKIGVTEPKKGCVPQIWTVTETVVSLSVF